MIYNYIRTKTIKPQTQEILQSTNRTIAMAVAVGKRAVE